MHIALSEYPQVNLENLIFFDCCSLRRAALKDGFSEDACYALGKTKSYSFTE